MIDDEVTRLEQRLTELRGGKAPPAAAGNEEQGGAIRIGEES